MSSSSTGGLTAVGVVLEALQGGGLGIRFQVRLQHCKADAASCQRGGYQLQVHPELAEHDRLREMSSMIDVGSNASSNVCRQQRWQQCLAMK